MLDPVGVHSSPLPVKTLVAVVVQTKRFVPREANSLPDISTLRLFLFYSDGSVEHVPRGGYVAARIKTLQTQMAAVSAAGLERTVLTLSLKKPLPGDAGWGRVRGSACGGGVLFARTVIRLHHKLNKSYQYTSPTGRQSISFDQLIIGYEKLPTAVFQYFSSFHRLWQNPLNHDRDCGTFRDPTRTQHARKS